MTGGEEGRLKDRLVVLSLATLIFFSLSLSYWPASCEIATAAGVPLAFALNALSEEGCDAKFALVMEGGVETPCFSPR